ncbi:glycosyl transferase [Vulcanimicrobium alpinum]|uniref:Glycosyl transferase n=1 Tax=Vulcanimicrobium alpinum TaxID=3016050 RepID=A0AAN2CB95_UNVUL|nr:glycosyltransferase [Vulcanimicrobium alpinum]BDE08189.1 glycosyl transferase [Vulcanimicrobium alpinum]
MTADVLRISVVVPTYNRLDTLRHVVPSLAAQDLRRGEFEVIVADSHSTDGTAEFLAKFAERHPFVRHLPGPYTGRASARNAGIEAARGRIVLFTDADIIASPDLLSRHLAHHERPGVRAVVGMEVQVVSYEDYLAKRADRSKRLPLHGEKPKKLSWLYFLTGNASVPKAELDRVGRFDEDFTGYGHEDLELGYRLQHAGVPIFYEPNAVDYHWHPVPWDEQQQKYELAGRSTVRFYRKHPAWDVQLRLGMTPVSLALHDVVDRVAPLKAWIENGAGKPGFSRTLSYQYHYLTGVKAALRGSSSSR